MGPHVPKSVAITTLYAQAPISCSQLFNCYIVVLSRLRSDHWGLLFLLLRIRNFPYSQIVMCHNMKSKGCIWVVLLKISETKVKGG